MRYELTAKQPNVLGTHTGKVWSVNHEGKEATSLKLFNTIAGEIQIFPKRLSARVAE